MGVAVRVVPDGARPDLARELPGAIFVVREHRGVEPVYRVVRDRDLVLLALRRYDAQHGAEDLVAGDRRVVVHVAEDGGLDEPADVEAGRPVPARRQPGALLAALVEQPADLVELPLHGDRPHVDAGLERVTDPHLGELSAQRLDELVMAVLAHDDPRERRADLAGELGGRPGQGRRGGRDVVVVQDQRGRLAAELEIDPRDPLGTDSGDPAAGGGRAGEADLVDARVADQFLGDLAIGGDDVQHPRRQAGLLRHLREQVGSYRRLWRGFQHDRAAGQQGRRDFPAHGHDSRVPRDDRADDADRLSDEPPVTAPGGLVPLDELEGVGQPGVEIVDARYADAAGDGIDVQDAHLGRPDVAQVLGPLAQAGGDRPHVLRALCVGHTRPRPPVEGLPCRGDRPGHVLPAGRGDADPYVFGGGLDYVDETTAAGRDPFAADIQTVRVSDGHGIRLVNGHWLVFLLSADSSIRERMTPGRGMFLVQLLGGLLRPAVHVHHEAGVGSEQRHLALCVAAVRAMRVRVEQLPDREPVGRFPGRRSGANGLGRGHGLRPFCAWILPRQRPARCAVVARLGTGHGTFATDIDFAYRKYYSIA